MNAMERKNMEAKEYLENSLYSRGEVEDWSKGNAFKKYDTELGWVHRNTVAKDGVDGSFSIHTYDQSGARRMIMNRDKPCRINTYGDSFTECCQVNDGETWQEITAAHLFEPIRNFGAGGYSVYQAYLRMKREETRTPAEYIIFNIYDDDHYRNLNGRCGPPRPYVKVNSSTGEFIKYKNPCPTPKSLHNLGDLEWVYKTYKEDFALKITLAHENVKEGNPETSYAEIVDLAARHGIQTQINDSEKLVKTADTLYTNAAIFASMRIVEKVEEFAKNNGKKVLYILSFSSLSIAERLRSGYRFDQEFVDFFQKKGLSYVDLLEAHAAEYTQFKTSVEDYITRYYVKCCVGHYNPRGNFFEAFAVKNKLVDMLKPKPISYQDIV